MKSKLKLAFDELEKELTIITQSELAQLMGGTGSGYDIDAVLGQIASDLIAMGFPLTESSGNYYFNSSGNGIILEAVEVYAYSTGMNSSGDGHSGYSSGLGGGDGPLDMVIGYLQNMGFSFSYSNGSYSYHNNNNNNSSSNSSSDPWKRDSNGNIIATPTPDGRTTTFPEQGTVNGLIFQYREMELTDIHGKKYVVYETMSVWDTNTATFLSLDECYQSNCFGLAVADGKYYFWDDTSTAQNEFSFEAYKNAFYEETTSYDPSATLAVVYSGNYAIHAGKYDMAQGYAAKGMLSDANTYYSEAAFKRGEAPAGTPDFYPGTVKYYKLK